MNATLPTRLLLRGTSCINNIHRSQHPTHQQHQPINKRQPPEFSSSTPDVTPLLLKMVKVPSRVTALAALALLASTSSCTTTGGTTTTVPTPTTPASNICPPTTAS